MSEKQNKAETAIQLLGRRLLRILTNNWKLKAISLVLSLTIWGVLISEDASLTREKTFTDVPISITGTDVMLRNGFIITKGLSELPPIRMRAEVPQKMYESASPSNYSVRIDVSRINATGKQVLPVQTSNSISYGAVSWLSQTEVEVQVEEYITRRRIPVRLQISGKLSEGRYASGASVDPGMVMISGPRSLIAKVSYLSAEYDQTTASSIVGTAFSAVPFRLMDAQANEIASDLITVSSENVLLDTLLIEQTIYPTKAVGLNLTGITRGQPASGYRVVSIQADPEEVVVAAEQSELDGILSLDLLGVIDVTGLNETFIRAVRVDKPAGAVHLSENSVYVTIQIIAEDMPTSSLKSTGK